MKVTIAISVGAVALCLCALLLTIRATVAAVPAEIDSQAAGIRRDATTQLSGIRTAALGELHEANELIDRQFSGTRADLRQTVKESVAAVVAPIEGLRADLKPTLTNVASASASAAVITSHVADALPAFTDCALLDADGVPVGGNPDCVFNRFQGVSKAVEQSAQAIAAAAPQLTAASVSIGNSAAGVAHSADVEAKALTAPQTTRQKLMTWLELLPRIGLKIL